MDENNRRMATNIRLQMTNLAESFARSGDPGRSLEVMDLLLTSTPSRNVPFSRVMLPVVELPMVKPLAVNLPSSASEISKSFAAVQ